MAYMDILALLLSAEAEEGAIAATEALASTGGGHPQALLLEIGPNPIEARWGAMTSKARNEVSQRAHEGFVQEEASLRARLGASWIINSLATPEGLIGERAAEAARYAELAVVGGPLSGWKRQLFEGVLFGSGRPLVVVPQDWRPGAIGRSIVIAWDGGREAARAVGAATPLLERADRVSILTIVGAAADDERAAASGEALAAHLGRCGFAADPRIVERRGRAEADVLMEECAELGADLIVMGGYGHARLQQFVFGGLTREIIADARAPALLMAH